MMESINSVIRFSYFVCESSSVSVGNLIKKYAGIVVDVHTQTKQLFVAASIARRLFPQIENEIEVKCKRNNSE